jgi:hypothetical protein
MDKRYKTLTIFFLSCLFFWPAFKGECYAPAGYKEIPAAIGALKMPVDAYVVEIDMADAFAELSARNPQAVKEMEAMKRLINLFQVTINDGESYRTAIGIAFFLDNSLFVRPYMSEERKERAKIRLEYGQLEKILYEQKHMRREMDILNAAAKTDGRMYAPPDKKGRRQAFKITVDKKFRLFEQNPTMIFDYEWPDIEAARINGEFGLKSDLRMAGSLFGFMANIYAAGFVFNHEGDKGVNILLFAAPESEHEFWAPIFAQAVEVR